MRLKRYLSVLCGCALVLMLSALLGAQTVSGSINGTVVDASGAVIPGAKLHLVESSTNAARDAQSSARGVFRFPNLAPGSYTLSITANGFKQSTVNAIVLTAGETRDLGKTALQVGNVSQEVTVTAAVTPIQTTSSEVSHAITGAALDSLPLLGRDMFGAMRLNPGVQSKQNYGVVSENDIGSITINGNTSAKNFTVDGVTDLDTGSNGTLHYEPNMDAIQEVKILSSNYNAEYGRNSGGTITVVTKSGTTKFHGTGWLNHRHEQFNANDYFNNLRGLSRPLYRYNIAGWSFGGPVPVGWFKDKLFFFGSQEYTNQLGSNVVHTQNTPTAAELLGDFSGVVDGKGNPITIYEPNTGTTNLSAPKGTTPTATPFPDNKIPGTLISPIGQAMLGFFPAPNYAPTSGPDVNQANFKTQASAPHPHRNDVLRIDFNPTSKLTSYFRWIRDVDDTTALFNGLQFNIKPIDHPNPGHGYAWSATYVLSPTLINETTVGESWNTWSWYFLPGSEKQVDRSIFGANAPPLLVPIPTSPKGVNGYDNLIPHMSFGSAQPNMMSYTGGNFDYYNANTIWTVTDNVSKIAGDHQLKFGIYVEHNNKLQPSGTGYTGSYNFGQSSTNPADTTDGYANALLGNFGSFTQTSARPVFSVNYWNVEFYAQDSWHAARNLTLDLGVRFYHQTPQVDDNFTFSQFVPSLYSKADMARIFIPYCSGSTATPCPTADQFAVDPGDANPTNPTLNPLAYVGSFVPGSGTYNSGMVVLGKNGVAPDPYTTSALAIGPRAGFAWDVFGNGKTALRGGFGVFYNRLDGNQVYNMSGQMPTSFSYGVTNGTFNPQYGSFPTVGVVGPASINYFSGDTPWPVVMNTSLGIQQDLGHHTALKVTYAGNFSRKQNLRVNQNPIPLGANFNPKNISPVTGKPLTQSGSALERTKYYGYQNLNQLMFYGHSNYNALQASVERRLSNGFLMGVAYTWAHALGATSYDPLMGLGAPYQNNDARNYGNLGSDRRQSLVINYSYAFPNPANFVARALVGHWTVSGLTTFTTGGLYTPGFKSPGDTTGSGSESSRLIQVSNPQKNVPAGLLFNPSAFAIPAVGSGDIGNLGVNPFHYPGYNDWDVSLTKAIPFGFERGDQLTVQIQAFNVLNHPQFTGWGTNISNSNVGQPTGDNGGRIMALNVRYSF